MLFVNILLSFELFLLLSNVVKFYCLIDCLILLFSIVMCFLKFTNKWLRVFNGFSCIGLFTIDKLQLVCYNLFVKLVRLA